MEQRAVWRDGVFNASSLAASSEDHAVGVLAVLAHALTFKVLSR